MKILFLHLSDMHVNNKDIYSIKMSIIKSLKQVGNFDECILVISGDLAQAGKKGEYDIVYYFLGKLIKGIKDNYLDKSKRVNVLVVPGNHDIDFANVERKRTDCKELIENADENSILDELKKFENFYDFANRNHCFKDNKIISTKQITIKDISIGCTLINSALFSCYDKEVNADEDKGLHFIPSCSIEHFKNDTSNNLNIFISHYPISWFTWESSDKIKSKILGKKDIIFTGHEHSKDLSEEENYNTKKTIYSTAGAISDRDGYFSTLLFNSQNNEIVSKVFEYDNESKIFIPLCNDGVASKLTRNSSNFILKKDFNEKFLHFDSEDIANSFEEYFVFPRLEVKVPTTNMSEVLKEKNEFINFIEPYSIVFIEGESSSGKTTLAKKIFITYYNNGMTPLYVNANEYKKIDINKIIKTTFEDQYNNQKNVSYENYLQTDKRNKILILDEYSKINERDLQTLISIIMENVWKIILIGQTTKEISFKKEISQNEDKKSEYTRLEINHFYKDKREELVDKVVYCLNKYSNIEISKDKINHIKQIMKSEIGILIFYPKYIIMIIKQSLSSSISTNKNKSIFNELFDNDIIQTLKKYTFDDNTINAVFVILRNLAFFVNAERKHPVDIDDINRIVQKYNEDYLNTFKVRDIINIFVDSRILIEVDSDKYRFSSKNQLAYLVARELNYLINNGKGNEEFQNLVLNVHKYINDDILIFLVFITENERVLEFIIESVESIVEDVEEYDIIRTKLKFIHGDEDRLVEAPSEQQKDEYLNKEIEVEKKTIENNKLVHIMDYYEEEEFNDITEKIMRSLAYLGIISRCLYNFNYLIKKPLKYRYIKQIYELPNKLVTILFSSINDDYNELVNEVNEIKLKNNKNITRKQIDEILVFMLISITFKTYLYSLSYASDSSTLDILINEYKGEENICHKLQQLIIYHYTDSSEEFLNLAKKIISENNNSKHKKYLFIYLKLIVRTYYLSRRKIRIIGDLQSVVESLFSNEEKTRLLAEHQRSLV